MDEIKMRQNKLGELRWAAAVSDWLAGMGELRWVICARRASVPSRINSLCGSHLYRTNELAWAVKEWRKATVLEYASPSHP